MAICNDPTDRVHMSAEERLEELAAILAAGVLRLRPRCAIPPCVGRTFTLPEKLKRPLLPLPPLLIGVVAPVVDILSQEPHCG